MPCVGLIPRPRSPTNCPNIFRSWTSEPAQAVGLNFHDDDDDDNNNNNNNNNNDVWLLGQQNICSKRVKITVNIVTVACK
jgi:hypothetical protein